jgi:hypothetical protein
MTKKTTVQLTNGDGRQLKMVSVLSGIPQCTIISTFIEDLFRAYKAHLFESIETGTPMDYKYSIEAKLREVDLALVQFKVPMDLPFEESDKTRDFMLTQELNRLDFRREQRKAEFKKAFETLFPCPEADKAQKIEHFKKTIKLKQSVKKADGTVLPDCEVA